MSFYAKMIEECNLSSDESSRCSKHKSWCEEVSTEVQLSLENYSYDKEETHKFQTCQKHRFSNNHALAWQKNKEVRK